MERLEMNNRTLGGGRFLDEFNVDWPIMSGAMAHAISSKELVVNMAKNNLLASYGMLTDTLEKIEQEIQYINHHVSDAPYACCLLHRVGDPEREEKLVYLFLKLNVKIIEASAFMTITPALVLYRARGLSQKDNTIIKSTKIIAKLSRPEIAEKFLMPPPFFLLEKLYVEKKISEEQFVLAQKVPLCDAITVEADSAGHTDKRPAQVLVPVIINLRNTLCQKYHFDFFPLVGQAGGIGTPVAVLSAFTLGVDYVVTGSINQATVEAGTSDTVKNMLAKASCVDMVLAPAADMFEHGVDVQILKKSTLYAEKAKFLRDTYNKYDHLKEIPETIIKKIETWIFKASIDQVWTDTCQYYKNQHLEYHITRAYEQPKYQLALIFKWFLGQTSRWAVSGLEERQQDFQIWCGPAMGGFNDWVRGSTLEDWRNRSVSHINIALIEGALLEYRRMFTTIG